ncbi:ORF6N domain-containing protein [Pedobacter sp.]|uniref:ORF6N domain-containing protein n=1 Tax=Pedobacter sp. TaxID=1411316 RepID=UPI00396C91A1
MTNKNAPSSFNDEVVINKIYEIRGQKVMLDSDLAELYQVETKRLNEQVHRNPDRFPEDFMFKLTDVEWNSLRSQIATSKGRRGGRTYLPNVFTEYGVLMLSSVLNSQQAIQANIQIVRVFARLRKLLNEHTEVRQEIAKIKKHLQNHDKNIELVFTYLDELTEKKAVPRKRIGFKPDNL